MMNNANAYNLAIHCFTEQVFEAQRSMRLYTAARTSNRSLSRQNANNSSKAINDIFTTTASDGDSTSHTKTSTTSEAQTIAALKPHVQELDRFMKSEHQYADKLRHFRQVRDLINGSLGTGGQKRSVRSSRKPGRPLSRSSEKVLSEFDAMRRELKNVHSRKLDRVKRSESRVALIKASTRAKHTADAIQSESLHKKASRMYRRAVRM